MHLVLNVLVGGVDTTQSQLAHAVQAVRRAPRPVAAARRAPRAGAAGGGGGAPLRADHPVHRADHGRGRGVPRRDLPGGHGGDGLRLHRQPRRRGQPRTSSTSPPTARTPSRSPSARGCTTASARTSRAPSSRRRWRSCPRGCRASSWTASPSSARSTASTASITCRSAGARLMHVGLCTFVTEYSIDPVRLGRLAEERGFDSLFFPEHTHIPVSRETPYPGGGELPREYSHMLDPFVALGAVASVTERIELGIGIVLRDRARPDRHGQGGGHARPDLGRPRAASAWGPAGTSRRCATTAPTRARASGSCASAWRR